MIAIIDYGMGNLRSVSKALEKVGGKVEITADSERIRKAEAIVFPGVGAFSRAMSNLTDLNLLPVLSEVIQLKKYFLGICLGFQLLFTESEEGNCKGLNIIKGKVKRFNFPGLKVPHMGWNQAEFKTTKSLRAIAKQSDEVVARHEVPWQSQKSEGLPHLLCSLAMTPKFKILNGIPNNSYFYFVHSYYGEPEDKKVIAATTFYGLEFPSVICKENVFAVQFHPEKSQKIGLQLLKNFVKLVEKC